MSLKIIHTKNLKWVDIVNPDDRDLLYLKENFQFHPLDFEDVVTPATRTKIDEYDNYHFIILLFPQFNHESKEIKPIEVDFFVGKNFLVTIHDGSMRTLNNIVHSVAQYDSSRVQYLNQGSGYLLFSIFELLFKRSSPILDKINHQMLEASKNIFQVDLATLQDLSELKKNIIIYRRIVRMHKYVLTRLLHTKKEYLQFPDSKTYFQDLIEYAQNIWEVLSSDKESVESFEETNQSLGTHRINDILQVLTIVSVIVSILTLLTDVFIFFERSNLERNFNIHSDLVLAGWVTGGLFIVTAILLYMFRKRKWL